jgi:hypothetical protein
MKMDKQSSLRQKLRKVAGSFDFDALINGVSTIEESKEEIPEETLPDTLDAGSSESADSADAPAQPQETSGPEPLGYTYGEPVFSGTVITGEDTDDVRSTAPQSSNKQMIVGDTVISSAGIAVRDDQMKKALITLSSRLDREMILYSQALRRNDVTLSGLHLSHINQILELLHSIDPQGDASRYFGIPGAPPGEKTWPSAAWTFREFAESPLSGLLPPRADDVFVREILYSAWGVSG